MGISRDSRHKRSATGAKRAQFRKKRKFELGRQPANTKIGAKRIHSVRTRGGNKKYRALRIETGNFSWASEGISKKTRIAGVVYHPSNNELVRTNTCLLYTSILYGYMNTLTQCSLFNSNWDIPEYNPIECAGPL